MVHVQRTLALDVSVYLGLDDGSALLSNSAVGIGQYSARCDASLQMSFGALVGHGLVYGFLVLGILVPN